MTHYVTKVSHNTCVTPILVINASYEFIDFYEIKDDILNLFQIYSAIYEAGFGRK